MLLDEYQIRDRSFLFPRFLPVHSLCTRRGLGLLASYMIDYDQPICS